MTIRLSDRARQDLDDIRAFTIEQWGRDQWLKYFRLLSDAFERITENPGIGRNRDLFAPGMRSLVCGSHLVFFAPIKAAAGETVILRIVHQRRYLPGLAYYDDLDAV